MKKMKAYTYFVTIVFAAILVHIGTPDNVQAATKKFDIVKTAFSCEENDIYKLEIKNDPGNLKWSSSNSNVAVVSGGNLVALTPGQTTITAKSGNDT